MDASGIAVTIRPGPARRLAAYVRAGYDRRSLVALTLLVSVGAFVGYRWSDLVDANGTMDVLLAFTWVLMAALLTWDVAARRDVLLLAAGLVGGGVIEWWGTNTRLWTYFTHERPPLWILPAWPIATLAIDRMTRIADRAVTEYADGSERPAESTYRLLYYVCVPAFVVGMILFAKHTVHIFATQVVFVLMTVLALRSAKPRRDFTMFVMGSLLGIFLEYWGTSRHCWTYYTREVPPPIAVIAHGFAAIAFTRGADLIERVLAAFAPVGQSDQAQSEKTAS